MPFKNVLWAQIGIGSLALMLFWGTLLSAKGSARHRRCGRPFVLAMPATAMTVPPVALRARCRSTRRGSSR